MESAMSLEEKFERVLHRLKLNRFSPFPFARSGFLQTIYGTYWPVLKAPKPNQLHTVLLPDGDALAVLENRPIHWHPGRRIILLVHGTTGCYQSPYMERMARRLYYQGHLVLRMNLRNCGPGFGLSQRPYHGGVSDDTRAVLHWIDRNYPGSPVTQVGFSLGGNVTLKMAGEDGSRPTGPLDSVVAVSPPVDLKAAVRKLGKPENQLFSKAFLKSLRRDVERLHKRFPELGPSKLPEKLSIQLFDEIYTAPRCGFANADEYYQKSSALKYLPEIKIPTFVLCSIDDPVVDVEQLAAAPSNKYLDLLLTEHGGHVGFLGWGTKWDEIRWCDQAVAQWIDNTLVR
jgi:predicted alpha/beta-fold hydrolase